MQSSEYAFPSSTVSPSTTSGRAPTIRSLSLTMGADPSTQHRCRRRMPEPEDGIVVVFDCESDCGFNECNWKEREHHIGTVMQPTVICALVMPSSLIMAKADTEEILKASETKTFWRDQAERGYTPVHGLLALFDTADAIVGYNCQGFDFPLLKRFYRPSADGTPAQQRYINHRAKCLDIMLRVRDVSGQYCKLDSLLKNNSLPCKTSDGREAIRMWEEDKKDELKSYCEADVELTARLGLKESLVVPGGYRVSSQVHGIRSAVASNLEAASTKRRTRENEGFLFV
jgi:hypothetical protein